MRFLKSILISLFLFPMIVNASAYDTYKQKFISESGAVIDTANNNMTHSEGQGYGLMFSLAYNDKETFDKIYNWTINNLFNQDLNLMYWAYKPNEADPVADKNNATDGDLFVAWTLLKAYDKWQDKRYLKTADRLIQGIGANNVVSYAQKTLLTPGIDGFSDPNFIIVNPSYFIYPALNTVAKYTHQSKWSDLFKDTYLLLNEIQTKMNLKTNIAPDWVSIDVQGHLEIANNWPHRSSYDAIRVPVYLYWVDPNTPLLADWKHYFEQFPRQNTPAYIDLTSGSLAGYPMTGGLLAVRDLVMGFDMSQEPVITNDDQYYDASLKMLVFLAYNHF